MRISDWSSDVCSSDLTVRSPLASRAATTEVLTLGTSVLLLGNVQNQTLQLNLDGDLASKATVFVGTFGKLQKLCLRCPFDQATNPVDPGRIDMDMAGRTGARSEEHTSELQSLMRISYAF